MLDQFLPGLVLPLWKSAIAQGPTIWGPQNDEFGLRDALVSARQRCWPSSLVNGAENGLIYALSTNNGTREAVFALGPENSPAGPVFTILQLGLWLQKLLSTFSKLIISQFNTTS